MPETDLRLEAIAVRLTQTIPAPAKRIPKPQASWRTLKPGQLLSYKDGAETLHRDFPPGAVFLITSVDSLGMSIAPFAPGATSDMKYFRWTDPDWQQFFTKIPKRKKKK